MSLFSPRFFILLFILLFLICALFIAFLPSIVSSDWGRRHVVSWINHSIPGKVEISHLNLHWGKRQQLEGFLLKDPEGKTVLEIEKFSTEGTLWQLLNKSTHLGFTQIQELNAAIITDQTGQTNLERALGIHLSQNHPSSPSTIILSHVNAESYLFVPHHPLSIHLKGLTHQEQLNGSFVVDLALHGLRSSHWKDLKQKAHKYLNIEGSKEAKIEAKIINFPIDLIDRLVALGNPHLNGFFHSLLGDRLNLTLDKEPSEEDLKFNLALLTPLMEGNAKGSIKNDVLTLSEPAIFEFNLTPESINPYTHHQLEILTPSHLEIIFSQLSIPLNFFNSKGTTDSCLFGFKTEMKLPEIEMNIESIGKLKILNLQALLVNPIYDKLIKVEVIAQAEQEGKPFDIHFTSSLNKFENFHELYQKIDQSMHSTLTISHLPIQMIPFFRDHPEWSEEVGPHLNAQLEIYPQEKEKWRAALSIQTPHIVLKEALLSIGKEIVLTVPTQIDWLMPSDGLQNLLHFDRLAFDKPIPLQFTIKQLQFPLNQPLQTKFQIESSIVHLQFPKFLARDIVEVDDLSLKIEGQNLIYFNSKLTGRFAFLTPQGNYSPLTPEPLKFKQHSSWKIEDGNIEMPAGQLLVDNSITHLQLDAQLSSNFVLELTQPIQAQYTLTPSAFQTLTKLMQKNGPTLQDEATFTLNIDPTEFDLKSSLSSLYMQGLLKAKRIVLKDASNNSPVLEDLIIPWVLDYPRGNIYTNIKGLVYTQKEEKPSPISAYVQLWIKPGEYDISQARSEIRMNFAGMPTSMLNPFLSVHDLSPIIGPIIDLDFKTFIDPTTERTGYWDLILDSSHLHIEGSFKMNEEIMLYNLDKSPLFRLTLTPESYEYLNKIFSFKETRSLTAPVTISGILSKFSFPIKSSWNHPGLLDFQFSTSDIQWKNEASPWRIEGIFSSKNLQDQLNFFLQIHSTTPLKLEGNLTNLFDSKNHLHNWKEMGIKTELKVQQSTPTFLQNLCSLTSDQRQKLHALFGDSFDILIHFYIQHLNGSLQASLQGAQGFAQLDGKIKEGILTLNQPLEGSIKMTPFFTQAFFSRNIPLLNTAIGAENPITFSIEPSEFSCPLNPFQLNQVRIGKGHLNLGKIYFRKEGEISSILSLIHPISGESLMIWFTPIYFELKEGILTLKRFDMLVTHAYTLANCGKINLMTHQADFVVGLTSDTLQYAFGIQGLDEKYILQIPLQTEKEKVKIDKKKAIARISSLLAQTQGGSQGKWLGGLLDIALSQKEESYPLPTTQPFPWEGEFISSTKQTSSPPSETTSLSQEKKEKKKKKNKKKQRDGENLKDLQQEAIQLLDQWFDHRP